MKILITNDDGIEAEGIISLTKRISKDEDVYVVAPEKKLHGIGTNVTFDRPIKIEEYPLNLGEKKSFKISGTPADCVILAKDVLIGQFDLLISGINDEPNIGDDVRFSGTLGACIEATFSGITSFGISLDYSREIRIVKNIYDGAAEFSFRFIRFIENNKIPKGIFLNINFPNVEIDRINGIKFVPLGRRQYYDRVHRITNPYNEEFYWIGGKMIPEQKEDIIKSVLNEEYIAITPMSVDNTSYKFLEEMISKWKIAFPQ